MKKYVTNEVLGWTSLGCISFFFALGFVEGLTGVELPDNFISDILSMILAISATWGSIRLVKS